MSNNKKSEKISSLLAKKKLLESKLTELAAVKRKSSMAFLLEGELERAELVLASKDVMERLQKMAEDLAKMGTEDIMPLTDQIKEYYGPNLSEGFNDAATNALNAALESVKAAKESINTEIVKMEGKIASGGDTSPSTDMSNAEGGDMDMDVSGAEGGDEFGGAEAAAAPSSGPLGRQKKA